MYFPATARETVVACMPSTSAISFMVSGRRWRGPFAEELLLAVDELVGDGEDGFLTQRDRADQAAAVADLVAQELAGFRVHAVFADHVLVEIIDPQVRQMLAG